MCRVKNEPFTLPKTDLLAPSHHTFVEENALLKHFQSDNFDWNSYELPALKTPATEHMPGSMYRNFDDAICTASQATEEELEAYSKTLGGLAGCHQDHHDIPLFSPGSKGLKHYFESSLRAFQELQKHHGHTTDTVPPIAKHDSNSEMDALALQYEELGYMHPGFLTPASVVQSTCGGNAHPFAGDSCEDNLHKASPFKLKLSESGILNKRKSKKGNQERVGFALIEKSK
jgi:hypothetical protein